MYGEMMRENPEVDGVREEGPRVWKEKKRLG
jgi:hypothetical protein